MAATTTARQWQTPLPWSWSHFAYERLGLARGAALFLASLGLYLRFRSPSLDDWDSVNFVRAIGYFDMRLQQPHPPGYPAYVFLARFVNWFTHDPQLALTLLSAVCGALCVLVFYQLAAGFGAGLAALPLAVMPLFWVLSEMALSDMPGLLFAVTAVWLLSRAALRAPDGPWRRDLALGFAVAGLGAGVRPQDAVVPISIALLYAVPLLLARARWAAVHQLVVSAGACLGCCLLWAVPLGASVDWQLRELISPVKKQIDYVRMEDSLVGKLSHDTLLQRLSDYGSIFSGYFGGPFAGYFGYQMEGGFNAFLGLASGLFVLTVAGLIFSSRRRAIWLCWAWLVPYGVFTIMFMQPNDPRKVLPLIPPMFLLAAASAGRARGLQTAGLVVLAGVMAYKGLGLARVAHTELTPPEQAAAYIASHYSPDDTVIFAGNALNHLHYHLPQYMILAIDFMTPEDMERYVAARSYRVALSLDEWEPTIPLPSDFKLVDSFDFRRNRLVLPKAWIVPFNVYERRLGPDAA